MARDDDRELKIALAAGLPRSFTFAIALGDAFRDSQEAQRYVEYLNARGLLDAETLKIIKKYQAEYFSICGYDSFQRRLSDDELAILASVSMVKGWDGARKMPVAKDPDETSPPPEEVLQE